MAAFVMAPLAKMVAAGFAFLLFKPREQASDRAPALNTSALDELASSASSASSATSASAETTSTTVPVGESSATSTPALSESERQAVLGESSATSTPAVPSHWVPVSASSATSTPAPVESSATSVSLDAGDALETGNASPIANDESARNAARALHSYVMRTSSARRDRVYIRAMQAAIGVTPDGLIGRQTAARIKALTGLRIPGLS